ncbi:MAG: exodeoxyribonuclease VII small subunit [Bacteroidetes bacterium]|nr:exodeoxyribonuclease VII small subunit [Bacteroidota bacterium]
MAKKTDIFSYDEARQKLEKTLADLESGKTGIDELEARLQEAKSLIDLSLKKLATVEKWMTDWE